MCAIAPIKKRTRKTAQMGVSTRLVGRPPRAAFVDG